MSEIFIVQAIGIFGSIICVLAFFYKNEKKLKVIGPVGNVIFAVHLYFLDAYTGAIVKVFNSIRTLASIYYFKSNKVLYGFISIYIAFAVFTAHGVVDLLPYITSSLSTYALYSLTGIRMRLVMIVCSAIWLIYNIIFMSIGGVLVESFIIVANAYNVLELLKNNKELDV